MVGMRVGFGMPSFRLSIMIERLIGSFRRFPKARVWPPLPATVRTPSKSEEDWTSRLPDAAEQEHLLELYFTYVHPALPILHKKSFMESYRQRYVLRVSMKNGTFQGLTGLMFVILLFLVLVMAEAQPQLLLPLRYQSLPLLLRLMAALRNVGESRPYFCWPCSPLLHGIPRFQVPKCLRPRKGQCGLQGTPILRMPK